MGLALLPGVTGRQDVFAGRRAQVLARLAAALNGCEEPGGTATVTAASTSTSASAVTIVAPALVSRTTTTALPDLSASGYLPSDSTDLRDRTSLLDPTSLLCGHGEPAVAPRTRSAGECRLHVTASAAVVLLRLAGWSAPITTHEIGAGAAVAAAVLTAPAGPGVHLVVFACATVGGALPRGADPVLAAAELQTHALHREVVAALAGQRR